uniref:Putative dipeptidyl peptidase/kininase n=1 Tax=Ixodes ricinus TaxID=34613 RepID=A0A0K8R9N3_IXORI
MVSRRQQTVVVLFVAACLTVSQSSSEAQDSYDQYLTQLETVSGLIKNEALASWYLENIADDIAKLYSVSIYSSWDYLNNLTDHNQQKSGEVSVRVTKKWREFALTAKRFDYKAFKNVTLQRILRPPECTFGRLEVTSVPEVEGNVPNQKK